jgi:MFS family permease
VIARARQRRVRRANRPFTWLWSSQGVSLFGNQVTLIAIPLLAAISLGADAFQMGLLAAAETVPYLVFSIPAGVLVDRVDRHRLLIVSNLLRAALLLAIPAGASLGFLSLPLLYAVGFGVGSASVLFDVAYQSYVPDLLDPDELLSGNQRIELSESAARTLGPGLGGALVIAMGGAFAIVVDVLSYLVATVALLGARRPKPIGRLERAVASREAERERHEPAQQKDRSPTSAGAWAGLAIVLRDRPLRDMAASTATFNLASSAIVAVFILFAATEVGMDARAIGVLIGVGNVGFVLGALAVGAVTTRYGVGRTLVLSAVLGAVATVMLPFAVGAAAAAVLLAGRFVGAFAIPLFNVNARALRQSRAPREAIGRVNAVFRLIDWGTVPIGALLGGWVGSVYGLHATLVLGGLLGVASAAWLVWSPLRHVVRLEAEVVEGTHVGRPTSWRQDRRSPRPAMLGAAGAVGWPLTITGRLPTIRWPWLPIGGVALQLAILPPVSIPVGDAAPILYVVSSAAVLACVLRNVRIRGLAIIALGGASNLLAIVTNGGHMPVSPDAARNVGQAVASGYTNTVELADAVLKPLTDIIVVAPPLPFANVYSVGDLLIVVGVAVALVSAILRQTGAGAANASTRSLGTSGP